VIHLDTHVLVLLYAGNVERLGAAGRTLIESEDLTVSPAVILELQLLHEIKRLKVAPSKLMEDLAANIGVRVSELRFKTVVEHAMSETWVRDPFDRLIVANAKAENAVLVTKDEKIRQHVSMAVW